MTEYIPFLIMVAILMVCSLMLVIRFILGPTSTDRLAIIEAFTPVLLALIAIYAVIIDTTYFFDALLVMAVMAFLSTVAAVKYVEQGDIKDD